MKDRDLACRSDVGTSHSAESVASARLMSSPAKGTRRASHS